MVVISDEVGYVALNLKDRMTDSAMAFKVQYSLVDPSVLFIYFKLIR